MRSNRSMPASTVIPVLGYDNVPEAAAWLVRVFGLRERLRIADHRIQMQFGDADLVISDAGSPAPKPRPSFSVMLRVDDVDAHYARVTAAGADVAGPPETFPYGERQYSVRDPGGHRWTFSQTVDDVDPVSWGGEPVG